MTVPLTIALIGLHLTVLPDQSRHCIGEFYYTGDLDTLKNGYCDHLGRWVVGLITLETYNQSAPVHSRGAVVWYDKGVMENTASMMGVDLTPYKDGIAMMSCSDFGAVVWLKRPGLGWEGPYIVVDCAQRQHMFSAIYYTGEVAEVGNKTALEWGMVTETESGRQVNAWVLTDVEVFKGSSPPPAESVPIDYVSWWTGVATFTNGYRFN